MKKREFLKTGTVLATGIVATSILPSCKSDKGSDIVTKAQSTDTAVASFSLPSLPYEYSALEPYIDVMTMEIHHSKHHAAYVNNLNSALSQNADFNGMAIERIMENITAEQANASIRNNGGGHYNHSLFWSIIGPAGSNSPGGQLADMLISEFGSVENFQEAFTKTAMSVFGSGWAWLSKDSQGKLFISKTANQDNPLMKNIIDAPGKPILGLDVWEHAYYLKYQNVRADYVRNFYKIINWDAVAARLSS